MAKFVIECPKCGRYVEVKTGFFVKKNIDCFCGHTINVKTDKLINRHCSNCGNDVVFNQNKGDKARCPVCGEPINTSVEQGKFVEFSCGQCGIKLNASKGANIYTCPVCDHVNSIAERIKIEELKNNLNPSVIKYEGNNETIVWKHPIEDFCMGSQLIVHESQEAIFFRDGQALDLFGPGRYTLETQKLPLLEKKYQLTEEQNQIFHSEVYFINKTVHTPIKWGTPEKIRFLDSFTGVPLEIAARGMLNLEVSDTRKLMIKLVGTTSGIAWEEKDGFDISLQNFFRPVILSTLKTQLPAIIKSQQINLLEIDAYYEDISTLLRNKMIPNFEEYGLTIPEMFISEIILPEDNPDFKKIRDLHRINLQTNMLQAEASIKTAQAQSEALYRTAQEQSKAEIAVASRIVELEKQTTETEIAKHEAERRLIQAQVDAQAQRLVGLTEAEIMQAKGYSHKDEIEADVKKAYAAGLGQMGSNGTGGSSLGDIANLGITLGAMGGVINMTKEAVSPMFNTTPNIEKTVDEKTLCPNCGMEISSNAKFCLECGTKIEKKVSNEIICSSCGKKTPKGKFCIECGSPLIRKCKKCGTELLENAKFCLECGEKI